MKVAIYVRVSKDDGSQNTEGQILALRAFCAASGYEIHHEYIDHESAKSGDREQFQAMLADADKRKFKAVLVWALDRLTREGIEETFAYIKRLKSNGVDFISYSEAHFRTTGPAGELMLAVAAWIAKQERQRISDRTKAGLDTARRKGKKLGRRALPVDIPLIMQLHREGLGVRGIAERLGKKNGASSETVRRIINANLPRHTPEEVPQTAAPRHWSE